MNEFRLEEFEGGCKEPNQVIDIRLSHLPNHLTREALTGRELDLNDSEVLVLIDFSVHDFEAF